MPALDGLLVLTLEQAVAAPLCSSRLADSGARVIKIEREGGDFARYYDRTVNGDSAYFIWLNRGKESLVLDIKAKDDQALLQKIVGQADIFIQNLKPGAAARVGLGSKSLRERFPRLITCDISGYGEEGPYKDMKAYDLLVQAETGLCAITGSAEEPGRVGVSVCDIAAGMNAFAGILQALYDRERTGKGAGIQVSLFDGMADWMNVPFLYQSYGGAPPPRIGLAHPSIAPYGAFEAADGKQVLISIQNEREWGWLCERVLGDASLATDPRFATMVDRVANRPALDGLIAAKFREWPRAVLMEKLRAADIACGALNEVSDLVDHPQVRKIEVQAPAGSVDMIAPPIKISGVEPKFRPVPRVGAHSDAIRAEFGA